MKIGIVYPFPELTGLMPFMMLLQKNKVDHKSRHHTSVTFEEFVIDNGIDQYKFSANLGALQDCDLKIFAFRIDHYRMIEKYIDKVDFFVSSRTDGEFVQEDLDTLYNIIKIPNLIHISAHSLPDDLTNHPRVIVDYALNFFYFYYLFGYHLLNYFESNEKDNLVGVYNMFGPLYKPERDSCIRLLSEYAEHPIHNIRNGDFVQSDIGSLLDKFAWQYASQHITSYIDYNRSVASILFETHGWVDSTPNFIFTEKTLKAILFQRSKIFFIYLGSSRQLEWLHEKGFWFLNSPFYKLKEEYTEVELRYRNHLKKKYKEVEFTPVLESGLQAIKQLADLKTHFKTDKAVYEFLLSEHQDKFEANIKHLHDLLTIPQYGNRLLSLIQVKQ